MIRHLRKDEKGSVAIVGICSLTVMLGFLGLAMDVGNLVVTKTRMQNAADAAVLAGGLKLPDQSQATDEANTFITNNNFSPVSGQPTFTGTDQINYTLTYDSKTNFMRVLGINDVSMTVIAQAKQVSTGGGNNPGPPFNNTLYSGSGLVINGSQDITGSVHSEGALTLNGSGNVDGNVESATSMTINGSGHITGYAHADVAGDVHVNGSAQIDGGTGGGASNVAMPDFSQAIIDAAQTANRYTGNQTFNGIESVNGSIYVNGNVTLNGNINFTGSILATGTITINGSCNITGDNQIFLYSSKTSSGNVITINGSGSAGSANASGVTSSVMLYAPNGKVTINGSTTLYGKVIAKNLTVNGSQDINGGMEITSLPPGAVGGSGNKHVKLIK